MRKVALFFLFFLSSLLFATSCGGSKKAANNIKSPYPIQPVTFTQVKVTDKFWAPRLRNNQDVTIPIALNQCYITGRVDNFKKAGGLIDGYFDTQFTFDDTDIYKILEGASYSIQTYPNKELELQMDTLINYIEKAQEPDGYLMTARTAAKPGEMHEWMGEKRWEKAPDLSHEHYNSGHLYEAAVAHYQATGKRTLLDIAIKNADLLVEEFGPGKLSYEPGHQIIEMGLAKLYSVTGKKEYLDLARFFLDIRGHGKSGEYSQTHKPVIEQNEAVGHAVRAAYMYSGMADIAALTRDESYLNAIDNIWDNMVTKKYYITGGIGATGHGEAFGANYELPNMSAYCETCAAIANVYWNYRLFLLHGDSKYYDVLERTLYNGVISGVSLSDDKFFYPNPLESVGQHSRSEWFGCACCPSNVSRFMPSIPGYIYAQKDDNVYINLYVESNSELIVDGVDVGLSQTTNYPWDGDITIDVNPKKNKEFNVMLRIPGWLRNQPVPSDLYSYHEGKLEEPVIKINGVKTKYKTGADGYIAVSKEWSKGDKIDISFPMNVHRVTTNEKVESNQGKVSLERGPIVYCIEWVDNNDNVLNAVLEDNVTITSKFDPEKLNGVVLLEANAKSAHRDEQNEVIMENKHITAIPYYAWANRGEGEMAVWIPRTKNKTRPLPLSTISTEAKVSASSPNKSLNSINDGHWPDNSNDRDVPFYSLWPKNNTKEWIEYEFDGPQTFSHASVYWYDDGPWGGCRIPLSWNVQYKDESGKWKDVTTSNKVLSKKDELNSIDFVPVTSHFVRLHFVLPVEESVGIYEFEVK